MDSGKLQEIDKKIAQLKAQRQTLAQRHVAADRKAATRRAVILGQWLQKNAPEQVEHIVGQLARPQDREAFRLAGY